jgi:cation diffusion facilitator CzcD-associated flavoprotein CzcO
MSSKDSTQTAAKRLDVIIVGGGFGGMYATYKFREMGMKIQSFEAGGDLGGVWYWNRYPGARVDLPSIDYSYSFSPESRAGMDLVRAVRGPARAAALHRLRRRPARFAQALPVQHPRDQHRVG